MPIRIIRLGSSRAPDEGLRLGTVRRPPRGVRKERYAADNWYDVWFPVLAPLPDTVKMALHATTDADWARFVRTYKAEMAGGEAARSLDLLAALSHHANLSVGCYCEHEARCHRSVLRELLVQRGADVR